MFAISSLRGIAALCVLSLSFAAGCAASSEEEETSTEAASEELVSKTAHFETFVGQDGRIYFDLIAGNGQNVLRSQGYASQGGADKGIASVVANGVTTRAYDIKPAKNGEWYFNIVAANGEIVATSETYVTKSNATRATNTVRGLLKLAQRDMSADLAPRRERFETFLGENRQTYFRLRAGNGEIMLGSEGYRSRASALNGIESVRANGGRRSSWHTIETMDGQYAIHLLAANGEIIARGESYSTKSNADRAISRLIDIVGHNPSAE